MKVPLSNVFTTIRNIKKGIVKADYRLLGYNALVIEPLLLVLRSVHNVRLPTIPVITKALFVVPTFNPIPCLDTIRGNSIIKSVVVGNDNAIVVVVVVERIEAEDRKERNSIDDDTLNSNVVRTVTSVFFTKILFILISIVVVLFILVVKNW